MSSGGSGGQKRRSQSPGAEPETGDRTLEAELVGRGTSQAQQHRAVKRQQLEAQLAPAGAADPAAFQSLNRQLTALQAVDGRYQTTRVERRKRIAQNQQQIVEIQVQIEGTKAKPRNRAWKPSARPRGSNSTANASAGWTS